MLNATCLARAPFSPGTVTLALLSEPVHSGYESKSAITSMIAAGSAAMVSDCDEGVAMDGRLPRSITNGWPPSGHHDVSFGVCAPRGSSLCTRSAGRAGAAVRPRPTIGVLG